MTASAFSLSAAIPSDGFSVLKGEPVIGGLHGATRHYSCPHCMSWMFTRAEGLDWFVNVRPTMLDEPRWFIPFVETFTEEKLAWATTPAVHSYTRFPPFEEYERVDEGVRGIGRHPDFEVSPRWQRARPRCSPRSVARRSALREIAASHRPTAR
jgi:hypothetical protein